MMGTSAIFLLVLLALEGAVGLPTPSTGQSGPARYIIVSPNTIRPGHPLPLTVNILDRSIGPLVINASITRDGDYDGDLEVVPMSTGIEVYNPGNQAPLSITIMVPPDLAPPGQQNYYLRVEGRDLTGTVIFCHENEQLYYSADSRIILTQTDKAAYRPGETVRYRVIATDEDLLPIIDDIQFKIAITDPKGNLIDVLDEVTPSVFGVVSNSLELSTKPIIGMWTIEVTVGLQVTVKEFSVEEFVLPRFSVDINHPAIYTDASNSITVTVESRFTFDLPVQGTAELTVGYGAEALTAEMVNGIAEFTVDTSELPRYDTAVTNLAANVRDELSGSTESATSSIRYHDGSPVYNVRAHPDNAENIKPGCRYTYRVLVTRHDGRPLTATGAVGISVAAQEIPNFPRRGLNRDGVAEFTVVVPPSASQLNITTTYSDGGRTWSFDSLIMGSDSSNGVYLCLDRVNPQDANVAVFQAQSSVFIPLLYYEVIAKGRIAISGTSSNNLLTIPLNDGIAPSARLAVYFIHENEIILDVVEFDVRDVFNKHEVEMNFVNQLGDTSPGESLRLSVRADENSFVGVLGVDKSVILYRDGNDLSRTQIRSLVDAFDTTPIEEDDFFGPVFGDPFFGGPAPDIPFFPGRPGFFPPIPDNRRSATTRSQLDKAGLIVYTDSRIYGNRTINRPYYDYFFDGPVALPAAPPEAGIPEFNRDNEVDTGSEPQGRARTKFLETWLWEDLVVGGSGQLEMSVTVPDTVTTWVVSAFGLSRASGLGLAEPIELLSQKDFFITLVMPSSVVRGEDFELRVLIFHSFGQTSSVTVILARSDDFDILLNEAVTQQGQRTISVPPSGGSLSFAIRPRSLGPIEILVRAFASDQQDAVQRNLLVKPEGMPNSATQSFLRLQENPGQFTEVFNLGLPDDVQRDTIVPDSEDVRLYLSGDIMGQTMNNLDALLRLPTGCGEQNMMGFAPDVAILKYLDAVQFDNPEIQAKALSFLRTGYQRELNYRHSDGSYSAFGEDKERGSNTRRDPAVGSTWLTAFVVKSFTQAIPFIYIDQEELSESIGFLISKQSREGVFQEFGRIIDRGIEGGVNGNVAVTAYNLIAVIKAVQLVEISPERVSPENIENARRLACSYLEREYIRQTDRFVLAITTYALHLCGSRFSDSAIAELEGMGIMEFLEGLTPPDQIDAPSFRRSPPSQGVELAAYTLLAYLERGDGDSAQSIVKWLVTQRGDTGGFGSTQDTVLGIEALAEFASRYGTDSNFGSIVVEGPEGVVDAISINRANAQVLQEIEIPYSSGEIRVRGNGAGALALCLVTFYNTMRTDGPQPFIFPVTAVDVSPDMILVTLCGRYQGNQEGGTSMSIMRCDIPSGYSVVDPDRNQQASVDPLFQRGEMDDGQFVVYWDEIPSFREVCAEFYAERRNNVGNGRPTYCTIQDYYKPEEAVSVNYITQAIEDSDICRMCEDCGCEPRDCQERGCRNGGSCTLSTAGYVCDCPQGFEGAFCEVTECNDRCPEQFDPVCGSDGRTYGNGCHFRNANCRDPLLFIARAGECQVTECNDRCTEQFDPVCGSDGRTYGNGCHFRNANCRDSLLFIAHAGACQGGCPPGVCQNGGFCRITTAGPVCECSEGFGGAFCEVPCDLGPFGCPVFVCMPGYHLENQPGQCCPGCVQDGCSCQNGGICQQGMRGMFCLCPPRFSGRQCETDISGIPDITPPTVFNCDRIIHAFLMNGLPTNVSWELPGFLDDSDGPIQVNGTAPDLTSLIFSYPGTLNLDYGFLDIFGNLETCVLQIIVEALECDSNIVCNSAIRSPVCGSDLSTYDNIDCLRRAVCEDPLQALTLLFEGDCIDYPTAMCGFDCGGIIRPVCASTGFTFENLCELQREICLGAGFMTMLHEGPCEGDPCATVQCQFPNCPRGFNASRVPGQCCMQCVPDPCANVRCEFPQCPPGLIPSRVPGVCCLQCLLDPCASVRCAFPDCPPGLVPSPVEGECCLQCLPDECPTFCTFEYNPVCGSNGETYSNPCQFEAARCRDRTLFWVSEGECGEPCPRLPCRNGGTCQRVGPNAICVCPMGYTGLNCEDGGTIIPINGYLDAYSPNYPELYDDNLYLVDTFVAPMGYRPVVNITDFATEADSDFLYIYGNRMELARLTGNEVELPLAVASPSRIIELNFRSDGAISDRGYSSFVYAVPEEALVVCGNRAYFEEDVRCNYIWDCEDGTDERSCDDAAPLPIGSTTTITSPGFPDYYPKNQTLVWTFVSEPNARFEVDIGYLDTELHFDVLSFGYGDDPRAEQTQIAELSGSDLPGRSFFVPSNRMWIKFTSDSTFNSTGFSMDLSVISDPCALVSCPFCPPSNQITVPGECCPRCSPIGEPCPVFPCQNGGSCQRFGTNAFCACPSGFTGTLCETDATSPCAAVSCLACPSNQIAIPIPGECCPRCTPIGEPCPVFPCQNGGSCQRSGLNAFCACSSGFTGQHCEMGEEHPCALVLCAFCPPSDQIPIPGECCPRCSPRGEPCPVFPCQNGGSCQRFGTNAFCACPFGFTGTLCETDATNPCAAVSCLACRTDQIAMTIPGECCPRCTPIGDPCRCENGGTCRRSRGGSFCLCPDGYIGGRCEINTAVVPDVIPPFVFNCNRTVHEFLTDNAPVTVSWGLPGFFDDRDGDVELFRGPSITEARLTDAVEFTLNYIFRDNALNEARCFVEVIVEALDCLRNIECPEVGPNSEPVCGGNRTFSSMCELERNLCDIGAQALSPISYGRCEDKCNMTCGDFTRPVCASTGETFRNPCELHRENCRQNGTMTMDHQGPCSDECPTFCPFDYNPVCGSDGVTYSNLCQLNVARCGADPGLYLLSDGQCGDTTVCRDGSPPVNCFDNPCRSSNCPASPNARCVPNYCGGCFAEWFGPDGRRVDCDGDGCRCENGGTCRRGPQGVFCFCPFGYSGEYCETNIDGCPTICTFEYNPVCGSDGETYSNPCQFEAARCRDFSLYRVSEGECRGDDCRCENGGTCQRGPQGVFCFCPIGYSGEYCETNIVCEQPIQRGPCEAFSISWGFNSTDRQCQQFVYGGCGGNDNRFRSREECIQQCDPCSLIFCDIPFCPPGYIVDPEPPGCCPGCIPGDDCRCENGGTCQRGPRGVTCFCPIGYSGEYCETNIVCEQPIQRGPCEEFSISWGFNSTDRRCQQFIYGGCRGNDNRFRSLEQCIQQCDPCALIFCDIPFCPPGYIVDPEPPGCCPGCIPGDGCRCENGGTCQRGPRGMFCICPFGYSGEYCETFIPDGCSTFCTLEYNPVCGSDGETYSNPCLFEAAQCRNPSLYLVSEGECRGDGCRCENGGTCQRGPQGVTCFCPFGYSGEYCETYIPGDTCRCDNGGSCHRGREGLFCLCPDNLIGERCETNTLDVPDVIPPFVFNCNRTVHEFLTNNSPVTVSWGQPGAFDDRDGDVELLSGPSITEARLTNPVEFTLNYIFQDNALNLARCSVEVIVEALDCSGNMECPVEEQNSGPICRGSQTFTNMCELKRRLCANGGQAPSPISYGSCGDKCNMTCGNFTRPVCASTGETFRNPCELHRENCRNNGTVTMDHHGPCNDTTTVCPDGSPVFNCFVDPCQVSNCPASPNARCVSNYCGGCLAEWYGQDGRRVDCDGDGCRCENGGRCQRGPQGVFCICPIGYSGEYCETNIDECPTVCTLEYNPVCGSNGVTYGNPCQFRAARCRDPSLSWVSEGECGVCEQPIQRGPCEALFPSWGFNSTVRQCQRFNYGGCQGNDNRFGTLEECNQRCDPCYLIACDIPFCTPGYIIDPNPPGCCPGCIPDECPTICTLEYNPVCGSNGVTYGNPCQFEAAQCRDPSLLRASEGECREECPTVCTLEYNPVCGSNGVTYGNPCQFEASRCQDPSLFRVSEGECRDECPSICTLEFNPVCGSDGVTYGNPCQFEAARCRDPSLSLVSEGECRERCIRICTLEYNPVCGSDGNTYGNRCAFEAAQCENPNLSLRSEGECGPLCPCTREYQPVCGEDGNMYDNLCLLRCADPIMNFFVGECTNVEGCPDGLPAVPCVRDPCVNATCPGNPDAVCVANYCSRERNCLDEWFDRNGNRVTCDATCADGTRSTCHEDPCASSECPANPDAVCRPVYCDPARPCQTEWTDQSGSVVNCYPDDLQNVCGFSTNICRNGGICVQRGANQLFECICPPGTSGFVCQIGTPSPCASRPCLNRGQCSDIIGSNGVQESVCTCLLGFAGLNCENVLPGPCARSNQCQNGGSCVPNNFGGYRCICPEGRRGPNCEDACNQICTFQYDPVCGSDGVTYGNLCQFEAAQCQNPRLSLVSEGECGNACNQICTFQYDPVCGSDGVTYGNLCQFEAAQCENPSLSLVSEGECGVIDGPCSRNPCENGGVCIQFVDGQSYQCSCTAGYFGQFCQLGFSNPCVDGGNPCANGGTCVVVPESANGFECLCPRGVTGENCRIAEESPCFRFMPCANGGTCREENQTSYYCDCPTGFYGRTCNFVGDPGVCREQFAGFFCFNDAICLPDEGSPFSCICRSGFTGSNCSLIDLGPCIPNPCPSSVECIPVRDTYYCDCPNGLLGRNCDMVVEGPCSVNPCENEGTCIPARNSQSYTCLCTDGFSGPNCQIGFSNPCVNEGNPCSNGGTCIVVPGSQNGFECLCPRGVTGENCRIAEESPCFRFMPCANGGTCREENQTSYYCDCPTGFYGRTCSIVDNPGVCREDIVHFFCFNNATCLPDEGNPFSCICQPGFTGSNCREIDLGHACFPNPCPSGVECIPVRDTYYCDCPNGLLGRNCEISIAGPCSVNPCGNDGTCIPATDGRSYTCLCTAGFAGQNCRIVMEGPCFSNPCQNEGSCISARGSQSYRCQCFGGFSGQNCQISPDPCSSSPCLNGGICAPRGQSYQCQCVGGFSGQNCELGRLSLTCPNITRFFLIPSNSANQGSLRVYANWDRASCSVLGRPDAIPAPCDASPNDVFPQGLIVTCTCQHPISQQTEECSFPLPDLCSSDPCQNGGRCELGAGTYRCQCVNGFSGQNCESDICSSNPCQNGGSCEVNGGTYRCQCVNGFSGQNCESGDICATAPCLNDGTCLMVGQSFFCQCPSGITGRNCELDPCSSIPCGNGGACFPVGQSYTCVCRTGFTGPNCEFDPCFSNPCLNGGVCRALPGGQSYTCQCTSEFSGQNCQQVLDPCFTRPCQNGGTCFPFQGSFLCQCRDGFMGPECQLEDNIPVIQFPNRAFQSVQNIQQGVSFANVSCTAETVTGNPVPVTWRWSNGVPIENGFEQRYYINSVASTLIILPPWQDNPENLVCETASGQSMEIQVNFN